jgi:dolichyl-phosphate-mannose-protein mannosyltransferase
VANVPKPAGGADPIGKDESKVTPQPAGAVPEGQRVLGREERVEYRDQDGNLLDAAQVSALAEEGKVTFKTKYETRTRLVDAAGNEIPDSDGVAPNHPDVEGQNPDTKGIPEGQGKSQPADANINSVGSENREDDGKPKPGSEANEATGKSNLSSVGA